jgi:hypothetical protein
VVSRGGRAIDVKDSVHGPAPPRRTIVCEMTLELSVQGDNLTEKAAVMRQIYASCLFQSVDAMVERDLRAGDGGWSRAKT